MYIVRPFENSKELIFRLILYRLNCVYLLQAEQSEKLVTMLKKFFCDNKIFIREVSCTHNLLKKHVVRRKPQLTEEELSQKFLDERRIILFGGKGGDGRSGFLRDKISAYGGPNGGNGGKGGDVYFVASRNVRGFDKLQTQYFAQNGKDGGTLDLDGKNGPDLDIKVPVGTLVRCDETHEIIADLTQHDQSCLICSGGEGGKGNRFFVSSINTTPEECTPGLSGEKAAVWLELRTLAHAGLVGFPNAGKSTLLRSLTRARPAVAAFAFTTLVPHLGVLHFEDFTQILIADTPGIVQDAHLDVGLGIRFLKHIERCRFLLYVIDMSEPCPFNQLNQIIFEMEHYDPSLIQRPGVVLANKIDLTESLNNLSEFEEQVSALSLSLEVLPVSGKMGDCIEDVILKIREKYDDDIKERKRYGKTIALEW